MLDDICKYNGFTGYKSYLKSDLYKSVVANACEAMPHCHYCGSIAREVQFVRPDVGNMFGTTMDGLKTVCLACNHKIKHGPKGRRRTVNQQAKQIGTYTRQKYSESKFGAKARDAFLVSQGFSSFASYMSSVLFARKQDVVMQDHAGRCACCRRKAAGVHFRWYSQANLMTDDNSGLAAICNQCRQEIGYCNKQTAKKLKEFDKRFQELRKRKAEQRTDAKAADLEKRAAAMESTSGNCCSCTEKAAGVQKFGQNYAPLCYTCNGKTGFDKDFYDHVQWLADSLAKGKLSMQTKEPTRRRIPDAGPLTRSTDVKSSALHNYVKIVRQPNGDSTDCPF